MKRALVVQVWDITNDKACGVERHRIPFLYQPSDVIVMTDQLL